MSKNKSISQRLRTCQNPAVRDAIISDWVKNWHNQQITLLRLIERGDVNALTNLFAMTKNKFSALDKILSEQHLTTPDH